MSTPLKPIESIEILNHREILFRITAASHSDALLPIRVGQVPIIPKHYWETRDLTKTTVEPPLGSGPYRVLDFKWAVGFAGAGCRTIGARICR